LDTVPRQITAVKIRNGRDGGTHNAPITLPFGPFVGASTSSIASAAVAVGGGAAAPNCALPLVVAECKIVNSLNNQMNCSAGTPQRLTFSSAQTDAIGFVDLDDQSEPNGNWVANKINSGICKGNSGDYQTGQARMQNGNDFSKVLDALRGVSSNGNGKKETVIGPCLLGTTQTLAVSDAGCPNPIFQGEQPIVGFVKATIVAVTDNQGKSVACPNMPAPVLTGPQHSNGIIVDIPCSTPADTSEWGGGRSYNESNVRVRLVQ
jgi:hypothetical protein